MKSYFKRISAGALALFMVLSLVFAALPVPALAAGSGYTSASDVEYYTSGGYTANWGYRGETCVFLSPYANNFYSGTSFDALAQLQGGSNANNAHYSALYSALKKLMADAQDHTTSYNETKNLYKYTDCQKNDISKISSFYSGKIMNSSWGSGWNREHTWPNSKGLGGDDENDIMMLRPTSTSENSSRGNKSYGISGGGSYYDPNTQTAPASVRGDVARITLYVFVRWGNTNIWGHSKEGGTWKGNFESLDVLLDWMEEDPVDTWEMGRNDAVQSITGTRNVFVDYPEFAWLLFGQDVPENITTPSDNDGVVANPGDYDDNTSSGGSSSGGSTGGSTGSTTSTNYTQLSSLSNGDKVVIVNPASKQALSSTKTGYYNIGVDVSGGFGDISNAEIFTAKKNSDGTWSFTSGDGKKLALADEYNSLNDTGANDRWELSSAGTNQFYMKNSVRGVYLDWYADRANWSTYNPETLDENYVLAFYNEKTTSSGGSTGATTPTTPTTGATTPTTPVSTKPTTGATTPSTGATTATTPVSTAPSTGTTTPSVDSTTPDADPTSPEVKPLATNPVAPPVPAETNDYEVVGIVLIIVGVLIIGGIAAMFLIQKHSRQKAATAEAPVEEVPVEETSIEETPVEEAPIENTDVTE